MTDSERLDYLAELVNVIRQGGKTSSVKVSAKLDPKAYGQALLFRIGDARWCGTLGTAIDAHKQRRGALGD